MEQHAPGQGSPRPFRGGLLAHTASSGVRLTTKQRPRGGHRAATAGPDRGHSGPALGGRRVDRRRVDLAARSLGVEAGGVGGAAGGRSLLALDVRAGTGRAPLGGPGRVAGRQGRHDRGAGSPEERRRRAHANRQRGRRRRARRADPAAGRVPFPLGLGAVRAYALAAFALRASALGALGLRALGLPCPVVGARPTRVHAPDGSRVHGSCDPRVLGPGGTRGASMKARRATAPLAITTASDRDVMVDAGLPSKMAATGSHRTDLAPQSTRGARSLNLPLAPAAPRPRSLRFQRSISCFL
jgi:hypothetical protein